MEALGIKQRTEQGFSFHGFCRRRRRRKERDEVSGMKHVEDREQGLGVRWGVREPP